MTNEMITKYVEAVKALKALGEKIADIEDLWDTNYDEVSEIDCMNEHCDACLAILKKIAKK